MDKQKTAKIRIPIRMRMLLVCATEKQKLYDDEEIDKTLIKKESGYIKAKSK